MDDYDDLAKAAKKLLAGKIDEIEFIATSGSVLKPLNFLDMGAFEVSGTMEATYSDPNTIDKILEAQAELDAIGPTVIAIRVPMGLYWKISLKAQESPPNPGWLIGPPSGGLLGGIAIQGDWGLSHHYVTEFSDGSREIRWCP